MYHLHSRSQPAFKRTPSYFGLGRLILGRCLLDTALGFAEPKDLGLPVVVLLGFDGTPLSKCAEATPARTVGALGFVSCNRLLLRGGAIGADTGGGSGRSSSVRGGWASESNSGAFPPRRGLGPFLLGGALDTFPGWTGPRAVLAVGRVFPSFRDGALSPRRGLCPAASCPLSVRGRRKFGAEEE